MIVIKCMQMGTNTSVAEFLYLIVHSTYICMLEICPNVESRAPVTEKKELINAFGMKLRIGPAARRLGVSKQTLTRWRKKGLIKAERFGESGHWVFDVRDSDAVLYKDSEDVTTGGEQNGSGKRVGIIYARVSTRKQIPHLQTQIEILKDKYPAHMIIKDVGSGLNFKRKGLLQVLELVLAGQVREVCVTHKDRLCRFAYDLLKHIFKRSSTKIVVDSCDKDSPSNDGINESELAEDIISIITVFGAKLHGSRSGAAKRAKKEDKDK